MPFSPALARAMIRAMSGRPTFRKIGKLVNSPADGRHVLMAAIACSSNAKASRIGLAQHNVAGHGRN